MSADIVFLKYISDNLDMMRVYGCKESGLRVLTSPSRPGSTKTTRQSGRERKLVIHVVYIVWLCFDGILQQAVTRVLLQLGQLKSVPGSDEERKSATVKTAQTIVRRDCFLNILVYILVYILQQSGNNCTLRVVDRPTQLICISDIHLLSWRWRPLWSGGTLYQWSLQPEKASQDPCLFKISVSFT